jgi:di/tricarboxylate transporter
MSKDMPSSEDEKSNHFLERSPRIRVTIRGLREHHPNAGFTFFELAKVSLPMAVVSILLITILGKYLLPDRIDVASAAAEDTREFTGEFIVSEDCPLIGASIFRRGTG